MIALTRELVHLRPRRRERGESRVPVLGQPIPFGLSIRAPGGGLPGLFLQMGETLGGRDHLLPEIAGLVPGFARLGFERRELFVGAGERRGGLLSLLLPGFRKFMAKALQLLRLLLAADARGVPFLGK